MNFRVMFFITIQFFMSVCHNLAAEKLVKCSHAAVFMTPEHNIRDLKALKGPIALLDSEYPFGKIRYQGNVINICWLDSPHLPSRGLQPWIYWGHTKSKMFHVVAPKTKDAKGQIFVLPFTSDNLRYALYEHRHLHMRLADLIEYHTDPDFFEIFFKGCSLNTFILPTCHTIPFGAFHSGLRKFIHAIANTEGAQLVQEITDTEPREWSDDKIEAFVNNPRIKLNIENCIKRDLADFTRIYKEIYTDDNEWADRLQKEEEAKRKIYSEGWTNSLSAPSRRKLSILASFLKKTLSDLDQKDPYYVYLSVTQMVNEKNSTPKDIVSLQLDTQIYGIFKKHKRSIIALENGDNRHEANVEEFCSSLETCPHDFGIIMYLLEGSLSKLPIRDSQDQPANFQPTRLMFHAPALEELNLLDPFHSPYLQGNFSFTALISVDVRNQNWWNTTISPLLEKLMDYLNKGQKLSPKLATYGIAHNEGQFSITDLINLKPGFEARRIHREELKRRGYQSKLD